MFHNQNVVLVPGQDLGLWDEFFFFFFFNATNDHTLVCRSSRYKTLENLPLRYWKRNKLAYKSVLSRSSALPTSHKPSQLAHPLLRGVICICETPGCLFIVLSQRPCANGSRGGLCCVGCT